MMNIHFQHRKSGRRLGLFLLIPIALFIVSCGPVAGSPSPTAVPTVRVATAVVMPVSTQVETPALDEMSRLLNDLEHDLQSDDAETLSEAFKALDEILKSDEPEPAIALLEENSERLIVLMEHEAPEVFRLATWMLTHVETDEAFEGRLLRPTAVTVLKVLSIII